MGWSESNISLKCQRHMTFTPPHQQVCIEFSIFANFFSNSALYPKHSSPDCNNKGGKVQGKSLFHWLVFQGRHTLPPPPLSPLKSIWCLKGKRTVKARSRDADLVIFSADPDVSFHFWQSSRSRYPNRKQRNHLSHQLYLKYKLVYCLYRHCISC